MAEHQIRLDICEAGRRLWQRGLVAANDGNISARLDDGTVLCTPTGVSKGFMEPDGLSRLDMDGDLLDGPKASIEAGLHLFIYKARSDVNGVVHAHPPTATGYAAAGRTFPNNILAEMVMALGDIPLAPFATPGTAALPESLRASVCSANAFLLANHGAVTAGRDVLEAYYRMETVEHCARIALVAEQLGPAPISPEGMRALRRIHEDAGFAPSGEAEPGSPRGTNTSVR